MVIFYSYVELPEGTPYFRTNPIPIPHVWPWSVPHGQSHGRLGVLKRTGKTRLEMTVPVLSFLSIDWFCWKQIRGQSHDLHGKIGLVSGESIFPWKSLISGGMIWSRQVVGDSKPSSLASRPFEQQGLVNVWRFDLEIWNITSEKVSIGEIFQDISPWLIFFRTYKSPSEKTWKNPSSLVLS